MRVSASQLAKQFGVTTARVSQLQGGRLATTQTYYIKAVGEDSVQAMAALDTVLCSTCVLDSTGTAETKTQ